MTDPIFSQETSDFVQKLDQAAQAHMAWSRRILRCAVLRTSPGDDVLAEDAHHRCTFGKWFRQSRDTFDGLDAPTAGHLDVNHRSMHDAVRELCSRIINGTAGDPAVLDAFELTQAAVLADLASLKTDYLARSARLDALTGLPLRYGIEEEFGRHRARASRSGAVVVVVLFDIDHFKRVNDLHGHLIGDSTLQHVANLLRQHCRGADSLFRFGGEEFLAVLEVSTRALGLQAVNRILQCFRDMPFMTEALTLPLRLSAGLTTTHGDEEMTDVVGRADAALYAAKAGGRDRACWADADLDPGTPR